MYFFGCSCSCFTIHVYVYIHIHTTMYAKRKLWHLMSVWHFTRDPISRNIEKVAFPRRGICPGPQKLDNFLATENLPTAREQVAYPSLGRTAVFLCEGCLMGKLMIGGFWTFILETPSVIPGVKGYVLGNFWGSTSCEHAFPLTWRLEPRVKRLPAPPSIDCGKIPGIRPGLS